jgi:hypothetical protein
MERQVIAKDPAEAIRKAKAELLKIKPKLGDSKYADDWKNPRVQKIRESKIDEETMNKDIGLEESITKISNARLKFHATKNFPHGSYTKAEINNEHKRRMKTEPNYHTVKPSMNEQSEDDMPASDDEKSMAIKQAKFIEYVAEEIEEYLEKNKPFPEWMQNKLSSLHEKAKDMHAVLAGDYEDEEDEMKEALKYTPPTKTEIEKDRKKDQRGQSRPSMTSKSASDKQYGGMKASLKNEEKDPRIKAAGVAGYNKPKATPSHSTKSHIVVAKDGDKVKTIRFGQAGVTTAGAPKEGESEKQKQRRASFKARHAENIGKGKMSAAYWADKVKW